MNSYLTVLRKYADFGGRARRSEYWMFVLFNFIVAVITIVLDNLFNTAVEGAGYGLFYLLYSLAVLVPTWAVTVRRLHDVGKSGWWLFIPLIPVIGSIWLFILLITDGQSGGNEFGPNPKEISG